MLLNVDRRRMIGISPSGGTAVYVRNGHNATLSKLLYLQCIEATPTVLQFPSIPQLLTAAIYNVPY